MIIPWNELSAETLDNLIESFVLREGTDYGIQEKTLEQKVADVKNNLNRVRPCWFGLNFMRALILCQHRSFALVSYSKQTMHRHQ